MSAATSVQKGDINVFTAMYEEIHKKLYYLTYFSLASSAEAVRAISTAARYAYDDMESCKNGEELKELLLKKTCEQIITRFRDYRKIPPKHERSPSHIKAQMIRLTDAERLMVLMWSVFGYDADKISELTGISPDVAVKKLESAQTKLSEKL